MLEKVFQEITNKRKFFASSSTGEQFENQFRNELKKHFSEINGDLTEELSHIEEKPNKEIKTTFNQLKKQVLWNALVATAKKRGTLDLIEAEDVREIFDEIESSPVMETLWKTYQKNYSYAANVSWHIIMEFIRDLYQTAFSDKFKADFL